MERERERETDRQTGEKRERRERESDVKCFKESTYVQKMERKKAKTEIEGCVMSDPQRLEMN